MARGVGCKCGWPLDSCNPDFSDGHCGRKVFEAMPAESRRKESTCRHCHQPIWIVYHGPNSNHTVEGRARDQRDEELRERLEATVETLKVAAAERRGRPSAEARGLRKAAQQLSADLAAIFEEAPDA